MTAKNFLLASLAAAALGLSACTTPSTPTSESPVAPPASTASGDGTATATPSGTAEPSATESTPAEPETTPAAEGDFPYEEGPVDAADFAKRYGTAMTSVKTMTVETVNSTGEGDSTGVLDLSDKKNPRSYFVTTMGGQKVELVTIDGKSWMRTDGSEWMESGTDGSADGLSQYENADKLIKKVTLVSKAERKFEVDMDMSTDGQVIPVTMWVDDQFRVTKQDITHQGISATTTYSKYDEPVEIPTVG